MQKKVIAAALILLMLVFMVVACNKNGDEGSSNYEPIDYTTDDNGNLYVTNVYGDLIPVTTGKDGSIELLEDLYTKTKEQAEKEKEDAQNATEDTQDNNNNNNENNNTDETGNQDKPETSANGIRIGTDSVTKEGNDAVIVW